VLISRILGARRHMALDSEVPLAHLASRYGDSEDEQEAQVQLAETPVPQTGVGPLPQGAAAAEAAPGEAAAAELSASEGAEEDWDEEEDWDSEDEELASAMEWADLREGGHPELPFGLRWVWSGMLLLAALLGSTAILAPQRTYGWPFPSCSTRGAWQRSKRRRYATAGVPPPQRTRRRAEPRPRQAAADGWQHGAPGEPLPWRVSATA
jgi:hypothetical protein